MATTSKIDTGREPDVVDSQHVRNTDGNDDSTARDHGYDQEQNTPGESGHKYRIFGDKEKTSKDGDAVIFPTQVDMYVDVDRQW